MLKNYTAPFAVYFQVIYDSLAVVFGVFVPVWTGGITGVTGEVGLSLLVGCLFIKF